jgi:predicted transcriptional regulator
MSKTGRPQKYPNRNAAKEREELIKTAVELFGEPYDDRELRDPEAPSINMVAEEMGTTGLRVRKMLITAGYYSTATSREVQKMHEVGATYEKIMKALGISRASVNGYLPFNKGVYKLAEPTIYSEQSTRYRNRKSAIARLRESIGTEDELDCLWNAVIAFENYPFHTIGRNGEERIKFSYCVCRNKAGHMRNEIKISTKEKTVARATVEYGYKKAIEVQQKEGYVGGSKRISTPGASSYLYPIFIRLGIITTQKAVQA